MTYPHHTPPTLQLRAAGGFRPVFCDFQRHYCLRNGTLVVTVYEWCTWLTH